MAAYRPTSQASTMRTDKSSIIKQEFLVDWTAARTIAWWSWLRARRTCWLRSEMQGATSYLLFTVQLTKASRLTIATAATKTSTTWIQCCNRQSWQKYRPSIQRPIRIPSLLKISKLSTSKALRCRQLSGTKTQSSPKKSAEDPSLRKLTIIFRLICTSTAMKLVAICKTRTAIC